MKRIVAMMIIAFSMVFGMNAVKAETIPTVTFDGTTSIKYNVSKDSFSKVFEGMVPGEARTLTIKLVNDYSKAADFYMSTKTLKAFEDAKKASGGAYTVSMSLLQDDKTTLIYGTGEGALIGADSNGLKDINGALNDTYKVATIEAGKEATLSFKVALDGQSLRNEYQSQSGQFQFDFTVQYNDTAAGVVVNNVVAAPKNVVKTIYNSVKTGDPTTITGLVALLIVAGTGIFFLTRKVAKKHEN